MSRAILPVAALAAFIGCGGTVSSSDAMPHVDAAVDSGDEGDAGDEGDSGGEGDAGDAGDAIADGWLRPFDREVRQNRDASAEDASGAEDP